MKILLLGEFSALHKNLKEGLVELGHDVKIASCGDGWKSIERDIDLNSKFSGKFGQIHRSIKSFIKLRSLYNNDVIQFVNPIIFPKRFNINIFLITKIIANNHKSFLLGAGDDAFFWSKGKSLLKYHPLDSWKKYDLKSSKKVYWETSKALIWNTKMAKLVDGVIPIMYEYSIGYREFYNLKKAIPIPVNTSLINYKILKPGKKLKIFHGLSREGFKGTRFIKKARDILVKKYPNDIEFVLAGGMPLDSYLKILSDSDIVIDQTYSHSCGVNAVYALAMGKIVLGGAEPESLAEYGWDYSPVLNITPNTESIVRQIEYLLQNRNIISEMSRASRRFAEEKHSHIKVAEQYIKTWSDPCAV